jgi:ribosome maturation protein SDO1
MPLERAQMRLKITLPKKTGKDIKKKLEPLFIGIEEEDWASLCQMVWQPFVRSLTRSHI